MSRVSSPILPSTASSGGRPRRLLLWEGMILMRYVSGCIPTKGPLKRYVRVVMRMGNHEVLPLPRLSRALPAMLLWSEWSSRLLKTNIEFRRRLSMALALMEATPYHLSAFVAPAAQSPPLAILRLGWILFWEFVLISPVLVISFIRLLKIKFDNNRRINRKILP